VFVSSFFRFGVFSSRNLTVTAVLDQKKHADPDKKSAPAAGLAQAPSLGSAWSLVWRI
jgi:hypothetical protein